MLNNNVLIAKLFEREQYNLLRSSRKSALYFIPSLIRFGFSRQITIKAPEFNPTEINLFGSRDDTCGQAEGHDKNHTCFSQIHERA